MMKKILMILAVILLVTVPTGVFAATSDSYIAEGVRAFCGLGINTSDLTDQQQTDVEDAFNQMIEQRKESISTFVADGLMTQEEANSALERLNEMVEYHDEDGSYYGMMGGYSRGGMMGGYSGYGCYDGDDD